MTRWQKIKTNFFGYVTNPLVLVVLVIMSLVWGSVNLWLYNDMANKYEDEKGKVEFLEKGQSQKKLDSNNELVDKIKQVVGNANLTKYDGVEGKYLGVILTREKLPLPIEVKKEKNTLSRTIGQLNTNQWYLYSKMEEGWYQVEFGGGKTGWVESQFFQKVP